MSYLCPVCGYNKMARPPEDFYICPCCGTEFENDDFETTYAELRYRWEDRGMQWFSRNTPQPLYWNPEIQLENLSRFENAPKHTTVQTLQEGDASKAHGFVPYREKQSWTDLSFEICNA